MYRGTYTALITPFTPAGAPDRDAFAALIERQVAAGIDGVIPAGTTGESATLDHAEHLDVIRWAVEAARGRCQVIAGTGSNSTAEAITMTQEAERLGADAALVVAPYYNKPSQEGLFRHYQAIAGATALPIVLYSVPGRCAVEIGVETVRRLAEACPNVVAIKEAGGSVDRVSQLRAILPREFPVLSGCDELNLPFLAAGAEGLVSVISNLLPVEMVHLVRAWNHGKTDVAQHLHARYYALCKDLFIEPNPVPVKTAMHLAGVLPHAGLRLPLCEMEERTLAQLRRTLEALDLVKTP